MIRGIALDTNALSAIADAEPAMAVHFKHEGQLFLPVIVLGEFRFGISQSRRHTEYERWLAGLLRASRLLEINEETANWYSRIRLQLKNAGTPIAANDLWIAALCRQHALPILSRDRDFDVVADLPRISW